MARVIPVTNKHKHVLCDKCKALYDSDIIYKEEKAPLGIVWFTDHTYTDKTVVALFKPCPECGHKNNTHPDNTVPCVIYWIIAAWRIFWHGRIDYEEEEK